MSTELSRKLASFRSVTLRKNLFAPPGGFQSRLPRVSASVVREAWQSWYSVPEREGPALYVHIPYCIGEKCRFCMYHSRRLCDLHEIDTYLDYLERVADYFAPAVGGRDMTALYVGGGTPSLLTEDQLVRLFSRTIGLFGWSDDAERTFENSFDSCSPEKLAVMRTHGINRVSFGLESVEEQVLAAVARRVSEPQHVRSILNAARAQSFREINVDLMVGLPQESHEGIARGMALAVDSGADAVTVYVYRHREDIGPAGLASYNQSRIPHTLDFVRRTAASLGMVDTVASNETEYQYFASAAHLAQYDLRCYLTRPDTCAGNSTLGLGHTASSYIADVLKAECRDHSPTFDPCDATWVVGANNADHRRRIYVLEKLYREGGVSDAEFRRLYGLGLRDCFSDEIDAITALGGGSLAEGRLALTGHDRLENAALSKFFWDQEFLGEIVGDVQ